MPDHDTIVFIPAWNEEQNLPAVLDELRAELPDADVLVVDDGSTDATAAVARSTGPTCSRLARTAAFAPASPPAIAKQRSAATPTAAASTPMGSTRRTSSRDSSSWCARARCDAAIGSRFAEGHDYGEDRYEPSHARRFGIGLLQKAMHVRLGRPFNDPTSGMAAVNAKAMLVMAEPYVSGAPEVEALLRLKEAGLRVEEVAVDMRERQGGESKLQGRKAVKLVLTVIGTLLFFRWIKRRRS